MKNVSLIILLSILVLTSAAGKFTFFSHSGSWCDYETKLGKVNLQIRQEGAVPGEYKFKMILYAEDKSEYPADCTIIVESGDENAVPQAYCLFEPISYAAPLYYKEGSLEISNENSEDIQVEIESDFYVIAQGCESQGGQQGGEQQGGEQQTDQQTEQQEEQQTDQQTEQQEEQPVDQQITIDITISFRQINQFVFNGGQITYNFFGLTTSPITKGQQIIIFVFLILQNGQMDTAETQSICTLNNDVVETEQGLVQADFSCVITQLDESKSYSSFKLGHSDNLEGIPSDETLLDPVKTQKAIEEGTLLDYSSEENKEKVPIFFESQKINLDNCMENGEFTITGAIDGEMKEDYQFTLQSSTLKDIDFKCLIPKGEKGNTEIKCVAGEEFYDESLIFEQQTIREGKDEIMTIGKIEAKNARCSKGDKAPGNNTEINDDEVQKTDELGTDEVEPVTDKDESKDEKETEKSEIEEEAKNSETEGEETEKSETEGEKPIEGETEVEKPIEGETEEGKIEEGETEEGKIEEGEPEEAENEKGEIEEGKIEEKEPEELENEKGETEEEKNVEGETAEEKMGEGETAEGGETEEGKTEEGETDNGQTDEAPTDDVKENEVEDNTPENGTYTDSIFYSMTPEEAMERAKISLSFRQLLGFQSSDNKISYSFYGLTTEKIEPGSTITMMINLIDLEGTKEETPIPVTCTIVNPVDPQDGKTEQVEFKCTKEELPSEKYLSFRFFGSDDISGIPTDEILLNPLLTQEANDRGELLDYSKPENQNKIPACFNTEGLEAGGCSTTGEFIIKGTMSKEVAFNSKFEMKLAYPDSASLTCSLGETQNEIKCKVDREIKDQLIFEQTLIKDGPDEIFIINSYSGNNIQCSNGLALEAEEKLNVPVSFRQVSNFTPNEENDGFSFYLAGLTTKPMTQGDTIVLNIVVIINDAKVEKTATCTLQNDPKPGEQGDFQCVSEDIPKEEFNQIDLNDPNSISISPSNDQVTGTNDIDEDQSSPISTDNNIEKTKELKIKGELTELNEVIDFSLEENKNEKPPSFTIVSLDGENECSTTGKLKVTGKFSEDINEEIRFQLPLSYPKAEVKCKVTEATKDEEVEIICKVLTRFKDVKQIVIEPRMVKNRQKEVLFINGFSQEVSGEFHCEDYNALRFEKAQQKLNNFQFSFLDIGNFMPGPGLAGFFMALLGPPPAQPITIQIIVRVATEAGLRQLSEEEQEVAATCNPSVSSNSAFGVDCSASTSGTPTGMELNNDANDGIAGIPSSANPENRDSKNEYATKEGLEKAENLAKVTISDFEGDTCSSDGTFTIKAEADKALEESQYSYVTIPISAPDTSALCNITVKGGKNLQMNCNNKEKFTMSQILIEKETIKDSNGNAIFTIEPKQSINQFACEVSPNSVPVTSSSKSTNSLHRFQYNSKKGLSGGAIAAIIVAVILAIALLGMLVYFVKNGKLGRHKKNKIETNNETEQSNNMFI